MSAQRKLSDPSCLCVLAAGRARQLHRRKAGLSQAETIDMALFEIARGALAPPRDWLEELAAVPRSKPPLLTAAEEAVALGQREGE